jgi:hypothetical protein
MKLYQNNTKENGFLSAYKNYIFYISVFLIKTCNSTKISDFNLTFFNAKNNDFVPKTVETIIETIGSIRKYYKKDCGIYSLNVLDMAWSNCTADMLKNTIMYYYTYNFKSITLMLSDGSFDFVPCLKNFINSFCNFTKNEVDFMTSSDYDK